MSATAALTPSPFAVHPGGAVAIVERTPAAPVAPAPAALETVLQEVVDALASALERPVIVTDEQFRLRAHSRHDAVADGAARACILNRAFPADAVEHFLAQRVDRLLEPATVPACGEAGVGVLVCVPTRWQRRLLGYFWLADDDGRQLTAGELERCVATAQEATAAMLRESRVAQRRREDERLLLARLLDAASDERERAVEELMLAGRVTPATQAVVLVASASGARDASSPIQARLALVDALDGLRRASGARSALVGLHGEDGVAVVTGGSQRTAEADATALAERLHALLEEALADVPEARAVVGVGGSRAMPELGASLEQAHASVRVAHADARHRPIARWDTLGVFRALTLLPGESVVSPADLHPGLAALLDDRAADALVETIECYLDLGADASAAATALHLHRSSLYYRLQKCQAVAGVDFRSGEDRLALHLAIKLARLRGWWPVA